MAIKKIVPVAIGGNAGAALKAHLEAIERLTEEKKMIQADITDHFTIAKTEGFDPKIMRIILKRRAMDAAARAEQDALVDTYSRAVGTPSPADADDVHGDDEDDAA
jgi:uncharacterized protein (UPF0335 family)